MQLRPYQLDALNASKTQHEAGVHRQIICMPTGLGKTVVFAALPDHHGFTKRVLVLVHREELAEQAAIKLRHLNPNESVGIEMADKHAGPSDRLIVASVQTLGRAESKRLAALNPDDFDAVIIDECHHATATTYRNIINHFNLLALENKTLLLGVTATPNRADGQGLDEIFEQIVYQKTTLSAIKENWLVNVRGVRLRTETDLSKVHSLAGDFKQNELSEAVNTDARNAMIVKEWEKLALGNRTLAFCVDIEHAKNLCNAFQSQCIEAEAVWGDDPDRKGKLANHRAGHLQVLTNCAVLTEGYDDPDIECVIVAKPTQSRLLFTQMAGRGMRLPSGKTGKTDCLLIDVVDNTNKHSLTTLASIYGMNPAMDLEGKTITEAVDAYKDIQAQCPGADLSKVTSLTALKSYSEIVDLFSIQTPPEVAAGSELKWYKMQEGLYSIFLPGKKRLNIYSDLVGKWNIQGVVAGDSVINEKGYVTLDAALKSADEAIGQFARNALHLVKRNAPWHNRPATEKQVQTLKKFRISYKDGITTGEAADLIGRQIALWNRSAA